ncbi:MAG: aspartate-semialdehyde dehydrogenase [Candidatus Cloacimonetes bacterium]|nr:aspartate-semialdehyde dehydrogenase [Candidatus Cloacimonadota bacterium]
MQLAIVGATGEVGRMMLKVLEERELSIDELFLYASEKSAGTLLKYRGEDFEVRKLTQQAMQQSYDYLLFSAGKQVSLEYAPIAETKGNTIIDNSSAFRRTHPLIVPEINGDLLKKYQGIIANPNCSTIQLVLAVYPMHMHYELDEVVISTYQSVSGAGNRGIKALQGERAGDKWVSTESPFSREIDLNVIPQIGQFDETGYCEEEQKMIFEIRKILNIPTLKVAVTTVRVPVLYGHAESVFVRFKEMIEVDEITPLFNSIGALKYYPKDLITPKEIGNSELSHIARVRKGVDDHSLLFWNVAHNVRLGAATNAVKIMEHLIALRETSE